MSRYIVSLLFVMVSNSICLTVGWNPSNFSFNPGDNYKLVWQDEFGNVGPVQAIINGKPAYSPNRQNWAHKVGPNIDNGIQNYTDFIENSYVQDGQLRIVARKDAYTSAMLRSQYLQEYTFGVFAAKIRMPYGQGMWPAWWLIGNADAYNLTWPTQGEIDIIEMLGGKERVLPTRNDACSHATVHWNSLANANHPSFNMFRSFVWKTPDDSMLHNNSLVYWTEWTPTEIVIGINEFPYFWFNTTDIPVSVNPVWAFSGKWPFYMILNIGIGGIWAGSPDNTTVWPQEMVVDWVRVYQNRNTTFIE